MQVPHVLPQFDYTVNITYSILIESIFDFILKSEPWQYQIESIKSKCILRTFTAVRKWKCSHSFWTCAQVKWDESELSQYECIVNRDVSYIFEFYSRVEFSEAAQTDGRCNAIRRLSDIVNKHSDTQYNDFDKIKKEKKTRTHKSKRNFSYTSL